jgi:hypothetical protein
LPNLKPNERSGTCQRYTGTVCSKYTGNHFIFVSQVGSQFLINCLYVRDVNNFTYSIHLGI